MPKLSVIIPVYNDQKYLNQCLDSVINQTLKDIEIICVDDGSTDDSLKILQEYQSKDSRVKVISQENGGAGKARNTGLAIASGKYLSFLDSDDFFEPTMLEESYNKLEESSVDFVVFHSDQYWESGNTFVQASWVVRDSQIPPYRPISFRSLNGNVFKVFLGWGWDKVYRADFIKKYDLKFQETRTSNDLRFVFTALVLAKDFEVIPSVLAHQRRNVSSSLSNTREKSWDNFYKALTSLRENLIQYQLYPALKQDFINYALHFSLWNLNTIQGPKKEVLYNKLKKEWFKELEISGKSSDFFYNKSEYQTFVKIEKKEYKKFKNGSLLTNLKQRLKKKLIGEFVKSNKLLGFLVRRLIKIRNLKH